MAALIKLGLAGSYKCDLILYLSGILRSAGKNVAVADASAEQFLRYCVPVMFPGDSTVTYRDIDFYYRIKNEEDLRSVLEKEYDVLLVDAGFNREMAGFLRCSDYCVFVTDPEIHNVQMLKEFIDAFRESGKGEDEDKNANLVRIFRDMCHGKINYKYLCDILDSPDLMNYIGEYVFFLDEVDRSLRLHCQYDYIIKFTKLSKEYKIMFADMLETFFGMSRKQISKSLKKAERGR